jgi:hypothetical protein
MLICDDSRKSERAAYWSSRTYGPYSNFIFYRITSFWLLSSSVGSLNCSQWKYEGLNGFVFTLNIFHLLAIPRDAHFGCSNRPGAGGILEFESHLPLLQVKFLPQNIVDVAVQLDHDRIAPVGIVDGPVPLLHFMRNFPSWQSFANRPPSWPRYKVLSEVSIFNVISCQFENSAIA